MRYFGSLTFANVISDKKEKRGEKEIGKAFSPTVIALFGAIGTGLCKHII